jgi:hypothetical protein
LSLDSTSIKSSDFTDDYEKNPKKLKKAEVEFKELEEGGKVTSKAKKNFKMKLKSEDHMCKRLNIDRKVIKSHEIKK